MILTAVFLECPTDFKVDAKALDKPLNKDLFKTEVTTPSGKKLKPTIKDNQDKTFTCAYTPVEQGKISLCLKYNPESDYNIEPLPLQLPNAAHI